MILRFGILVAVFPIILAAQAAVEYAVGSASAATTAAPAKKVGNAIGGTFEKLGKVLQNTGELKPTRSQQASRVPSRQEKATAAAPQFASGAEAPPSSVLYEDPAGIKDGMGYDEVMRRFGPPAIKTTVAGMETLCYTGKDQSLDVQMRNGKVTAVKKTGASSKSMIVENQ